MPSWVQGYKTRRANKILNFAVRQNYELLNLAGESVYLLQRRSRLDSTFQLTSRKVDTLTQTVSSQSYSIDPDTGMVRYTLWNAATDRPEVYPDIGVLTATVQASGSTDVWEPAVDKYSFIANRKEYAFDIFQDQLDVSTGLPIPDAVYVVFNTPPFTLDNRVIFTYGSINPLVNFAGLQPVRDNQTEFQNSLFGFEQWINPFPKTRKRTKPNSFLIAFPNIKSDFTITEGGLLRETKGTYWTTPPHYSPLLVEHDVVIRDLTTERFQITNATPIYIEDILVSQQFDLVALDPRSSIYNIEIDKG